MLQRKCACGGKSAGNGKCSTCEAAEKQKRPLQRKTNNYSELNEVPSIVHDVLRSPGRSLEPETLADMEPRFGHDFSSVRVHTDAKAAESARAVNAMAYTVGKHIAFGVGMYSAHAPQGRQLLAHELAHTIQQGVASPSQQLRLDSPHDALEHQADDVARRVLTTAIPQQSRAGSTFGSRSPQLPLHSTMQTGRIQRKLRIDGPEDSTDPAANIPASSRVSMVEQSIQSLCPGFRVNFNGTVGEVEPDNPEFCTDPSTVAGGSTPTGCCCLCIIAGSSHTWTIRVTENTGAQTSFSTRTVVIPPSTSPVESMHWTAGGSTPAHLVLRPRQITLGHELCGHAALKEINAHPILDADRTTSDVHDPTVKIERLIWGEQGLAKSEQRGLAADGPHRGESVSRVTIAQFPFGGSDVSGLPAAERNKIKAARDFIVKNNWFVDVLGHSDPVGSAVGNLNVSQKRADSVKAELLSQGVTTTTTKHSGSASAFPRFSRVEGLGANQPLGANTPHAEWRRVEILMANYPAGAQVPQPGTPTRIDHAPPKNPGALATSGNACINHMTQGAWL